MADIELIRGKTIIKTTQAADDQGNPYWAEVIYGDETSGWYRKKGDRDEKNWRVLKRDQYCRYLKEYLEDQEKIADIDAEIREMEKEGSSSFFDNINNASQPAQENTNGSYIVPVQQQKKADVPQPEQPDKEGKSPKSKKILLIILACVIVIIVAVCLLLQYISRSGILGSVSGNTQSESVSTEEIDINNTYSVAVWAVSKSAGETIEEGDFQTVSLSGAIYSSMLSEGTPVLEGGIEDLYGCTLATDVTEGNTAYADEITIDTGNTGSSGTITINIYADITYGDGTTEEGVQIGTYQIEDGESVDISAEVAENESSESEAGEAEAETENEESTEGVEEITLGN